MRQRRVRFVLRSEIDWKWLAPVPDGFYERIYTYCVDILAEMTDPQTVRVSDTNDSRMVTQTADGGERPKGFLSARVCTPLPREYPNS